MAVIQRIRSIPRANSVAIASLNQCVKDCRSGVEELRDFLRSVDDIREDGLKTRIQGAGKKLAFGFRRGELSTLQQKVHTLTTTVELALQTLTL